MYKFNGSLIVLIASNNPEIVLLNGTTYLLLDVRHNK